MCDKMALFYAGKGNLHTKASMSVQKKGEWKKCRSKRVKRGKGTIKFHFFCFFAFIFLKVC